MQRVAWTEVMTEEYCTTLADSMDARLRKLRKLRGGHTGYQLWTACRHHRSSHCGAAAKTTLCKINILRVNGFSSGWFER